MRTYLLRPPLALILACILAFALFLLDTAVPEAHFWARYLIPLVLVFLWGRRRDIYLVAALASVLSVASYGFELSAAPRDLMVADLLANHLLPLLVLWGVAWLLARQRQMQDELLAQRRQLLDQQQVLDAQVKARTAELGAREEQLAKIFRANPGGIAITRQSDGCFLEANDAYLAMVGYTRDQLIGRTIIELGILSTASRAEVTDALQAQGSLRERYIRLTNARGEPVDILYSSEEIDIDGEPCYLGLMVDITAHRRLEDAVRDSEERFRLIVENSPDVIALFDGQGSMVYVSPAFETTHGVSAKAALAADPQILEAINTPPGAGPRAEELARNRTRPQFESRRMAAEAVAYCLAHPGTRVQIEIGSPIPSGELRYFDAAYQAYRRAGGDLQVVGITRDITKRKHAEEALAATVLQLSDANQRLQLATDAAGLGIWTWNFADNSLDWDERMCELYAVPPDQRSTGLYYKLWQARVHPDDRDLAEPSGGDPVHSPSRWSTTFRLIMPDGTLRHIQVNAVKQFDAAGQPLRMIGVNRDVTDQQQYELLLRDTNAILEQHVVERTADLQSALAELQRAGRLKDEFMAMISHELRTPLTGVLTMSELLEDQISGPLNVRQTTYVKAITQGGERLLAVINGILDYTQLLGGSLLLTPEPRALAHLLAICATSQQYKAAAKGQAIAVQVDPPDMSITVDATALAEALKRLLDNAVKFTPAGGKIGLEACPGSAPDTVKLIVWDTGIGIAADQLDHILKPFMQADGGLARAHEGLGLSLAYVDQMVHLMGGTLAIESTPGEGSRFTITLPA